MTEKLVTWVGDLVLHAFEKKTRRTRKQDIDLARSRLAAVLASRGGSDG